MDVRTPWNEENEELDSPANDKSGAVTDATPTVASPDSIGIRPLRPRPYALVHLGVCSAPVAYDLAEVIKRGVRAQEAER